MEQQQDSNATATISGGVVTSIAVGSTSDLDIHPQAFSGIG